MRTDDFHGHESREAIQIEHLFDFIQPFIEIRFFAGGRENIQEGAILGLVARRRVQWVSDVFAETAVVEIAVGIFEEAFEKLLVPAFHQHIKAEWPAIQFGCGVRSPRRRNARAQEKFARDLLGDIAVILD